MDFFTSSDVQRLLYNKFVVIIGDSVVRGVYKDLVYLLQRNRYMEEFRLKKKCEMNFMGDELIEGGELGRLHNGKDMREVRQFKTDVYLIRYYYITRCYSEYMETVFLDLQGGPQPDFVVMNSCVWDITRYGPHGFEEYKKNLQRLFTRLETFINKSSLVLWLTTLPIGSHVRGGFMLEELSFYNDTLRFDVIVSNFYAKQVVADHGFEVLDLHHHFRELTDWRMADGIHWNVYAHRRITQLILTFVCESWGIALPHNNPQLSAAAFTSEPRAKHQRSVSCKASIFPQQSAAPPQNNMFDNNNNNNGYLKDQGNFPNQNISISFRTGQQQDLCTQYPPFNINICRNITQTTMAGDWSSDAQRSDLHQRQPWSQKSQQARPCGREDGRDGRDEGRNLHEDHRSRFGPMKTQHKTRKPYHR